MGYGIARDIGKLFAPDLMEPEVVRFELEGIRKSFLSRDQVEGLIEEAVLQARQALPVSLDYDPKNEGYRRFSEQDYIRRDLTPMSQDLMFELAYYLYDTSGLVKRFVRDTKNFVLGEGVSFRVENDPDGAAKKILDAFWTDSINQMDLRLDKRIEFLGLLGEQCWPVWINPISGFVRLSYIDPANVDVVDVSSAFPELAASVKLKGMAGRSGDTLAVVREEWDPRKKEFGRLVGDCFFFSINNPPNGPRGRSDLIQSFDFINGFEESIFDELDRIKLIKAFIWDVSIQGADEDGVRDFLKANRAPKPGSVRAHNERVAWSAVAPDLKMQDSKAFFDFMKSYLAACQNRPDSWLGSGGKAYQTEAELMGEPTFKDLGSRQRYVKYMIEYVLRFVLDQAVLHGALKEPAGERFKVTVNMPKMGVSDLKGIVQALLQLAQGLMIAEGQGWIVKETASAVFASVAERIGVDIDSAEEIKKAAAKMPGSGELSEDYAAREALVQEIVARMQARSAGQ